MNKAYYLILICFLPVLSFGQVSVDEETGNKYFDLFDFETAIKHYKKTSKLTLQGKRNLESSYKRTDQFANCEIVAKEIVEIPEHSADDVFNYVSILRMNKKYEESEEWMKEYERLVGSDQRILANQFLRSRINDLLVDQGNMNITNLGFNSDNQEFAPMYYGNKLVYTAAGISSETDNTVNNITKQNFLRLYVLDTTDLNSMRRTYFNNQLMGKYNEGVACFSNDGNLMVFSGNDVSEVEKNQKINVQLYFTERDSLGKWATPVPFQFNDRRFSFGHPFLTSDGKTLLFSSNKEGTIGGSDIWKSTMNSDNSWSEPMNLGNHVNTESNEFYPFYISKTNSLFFASEGRGGLGGLDLFVIEMKGDNFDFAQNLGAPLNSSFDDFSFVSNDDCSQGYFASNRTGGKGGDDIYRFAITHNWVPKPFRTIAGRVTDENGKPVPNAIVDIRGNNDSLVSTVVCDENGNYETKFEHSSENVIRAKSVFGEQVKTIEVMDDSTEVRYDFVFSVPKTMKSLSDLKRKGNSVYFHTSKWDLTNNGKQVLDYYAKCLLEDAKLKVEVNSFADKRSSVELNTHLSKMRMESTVSYLVSKGVPTNQIIGNYFGATTEGIDLNDQKCECTEEKLELCRRADLKLTR